MKPVRTLIVDDEPLARERIRTLLGAVADVEVVGECRNGGEAVEAIARLAPDLVFLDIQMPEMDGFDVIEQIGPAHMPAVVFATAFDRHALRAFEVHALDYLLKPFDPDRFAEAVDRAIRLVREATTPLRDQLDRLLHDLRPRPRPLDRVLIKTRQRIYFVAMDEVAWIEAARNYVCLHAGGQAHLLRQTLSGLEERLDPNRFVRIHRSTIVNLDRVQGLYPLFNGDYEVHLRDGTRLTLSRSYRDRLEAFLPGSA